MQLVYYVLVIKLFRTPFMFYSDFKGIFLIRTILIDVDRTREISTEAL
jgi:hypothetical protein